MGFFRIRTLDRIKDFVDGFAVSLDGPEEIYDARRGVSGAYRKTPEAMERLKDAKKSFSDDRFRGR